MNSAEQEREAVVARELAGHFGPLFEELPSDKRMLRGWRRQGYHASDNTQADLIGAARATLAALREAGFAVVPVEPTEGMWLAGNNAANPPVPDAAPVYRAMIEAYTKEGE